MSYRARHDPTRFLAEEDQVVEARVLEAAGSAPREAGAWMLVAPTRLFGTIGGGAMELKVVETARTLLISGGAPVEMTLPLGPEIGQCCGGRVSVQLRRLDGATKTSVAAAGRRAVDATPAVYVFGAGHVGTALARLLAELPVRAVLIDSRAEALAAAIDGVAQRLTALPEAEIRSAECGAAFVVATHDHALDFLIVGEALARDDAAYVGLIGSQTKRKRFEGWFRTREARAAILLPRLICPIGVAAFAERPMDEAVAKRPDVIALAVATEIVARLYATPAASQA